MNVAASSVAGVSPAESMDRAVRSSARAYRGQMSREEQYLLARDSMVMGFATQFESGQVGVTNGAEGSEESAGFAGVAQLVVRQFPKTANSACDPQPPYFFASLSGLLGTSHAGQEAKPHTVSVRNSRVLLRVIGGRYG